jgi:hypothetical protein
MKNKNIQFHLHENDIQNLCGFLSGIANDLPHDIYESAKRFITKEKIRQACKEFDGPARSPKAITFHMAYERAKNLKLVPKDFPQLN